jgi:hypothetical protein
MANKGKRIFNPDRHCGAKTREGPPCVRGKGERTGHPGEGRCWLHGGNSKTTHGAYASVLRPPIREKMDQVIASGESPLNLESEVMLLKTLIVDFVNEHSTFAEALVNWHKSVQPAYQTLLTNNDGAAVKDAIMRLRQMEPSRPIHEVDIRDVAGLIDKLGRSVDRIHRMRSSRAIPLERMHQLIEEMTESLRRHCRPEQIDQIRQDWNRIEIQPNRLVF